MPSMVGLHVGESVGIELSVIIMIRFYSHKLVSIQDCLTFTTDAESYRENSENVDVSRVSHSHHGTKRRTPPKTL